MSASKRSEYAERGSRRLPRIVIDAPVSTADVAKTMAILKRAIQDWSVVIVVLTPDGEMMAFKPEEKEKVPKWWVGTYGKGLTTKMIRGDIEYHLVEIRRFLGIREKWSNRE